MTFWEKITKILIAVFILIFSITVLAYKIPESKYVQESLTYLEETQSTIMKFSGTTLATSLAMSALPNDFATPLAGTVSDLNTYFVFMFAVIFVEKLIVTEGTKIALAYIIPIACILYILAILTTKAVFNNFATKLMILGISLVIVIPFSTHFTQSVCQDYLAYVDETIAEADAGAAKINEVMSNGNEESSFFDKLSDAFKTAIQSVTDLLNYFNNVIKKCVNSVAIMLVTTFVLPLVILLVFKWLLKELFAITIPTPKMQVRMPKIKKLNDTKVDSLLPEKEDLE